MKYLKTYEENNIRQEIKYFDNGQKKYEKYFLNCELHREDGPAYQTWMENGRKRSEIYFLYGDDFFDKLEWIKQLKKINSPYYEEQLIKYNANKYNI